MRFREQVAVITGAARGIGRATALAFVGEGAKVAGFGVMASESDIWKGLMKGL